MTTEPNQRPDLTGEVERLRAELDLANKGIQSLVTSRNEKIDEINTLAAQILSLQKECEILRAEVHVSEVRLMSMEKDRDKHVLISADELTALQSQLAESQAREAGLVELIAKKDEALLPFVRANHLANCSMTRKREWIELEDLDRAERAGVIKRQ